MNMDHIENFRVGSQVRLKSGSCDMTVENHLKEPTLFANAGVYCVWHDKNCQSCRATYREECLTVVLP